MDESCLAFTYVPTCTSQVAFACPTGPCWSRRWWCADWSVLLFPADLLPGRSRSLSYKKTMEHYFQMTTTVNHVNTPAWPPPYLFCGKRAQQRGVANTRLEGGGKRERDASDDTTEEKRHCHFPFTYHRPTSPTWTGAFKTGNRCKDKTKESTAGGEQDGKKYQNNFIFLTL